VSSLSKAQTVYFLHFFEWMLLIAALIVVVGLVGEHKIPWWRPLYDWFTILVAIGCMGEMLADGGVFFLSRHLQAIADAELGEITVKAGTAQTSANRAGEDATRARGEADSAKQRAEEIGDEEVGLRKKLADEVNTELAERKKATELEGSLAPRNFTLQFGPDGKTNFEELKRFAGIKVSFEVLADPEPMRAAERIEQLLVPAGWNIIGKARNPDIYSGFFDGVSIWYEHQLHKILLPLLSLSPEQRAETLAHEKCEKSAGALGACPRITDLS
jgi:hypothetical protein